MMGNNTLAIVSQSGQTLNFYDLTSGQKTGQLVDLIAEPHELAFDEMRNVLYISHAYEHGWYSKHGDYCHGISVVECHPERRQIIDVIDISPAKGPHGLVLDEQHDILYASVEGGIPDTPKGGGIIGICLKNRKVIKMIGSGWTSHWFVMTPDGTKAYTCNKEADFVSVIDLISEEMVGKIPIDGGCEQPAISKCGRWAYYPTPAISGMMNPRKPCIQVIDTSTDKIVRSIPLEHGAVTIHTDSKDRLLVEQYRFDVVEGDSKQMAPLNGRLLVLSPTDDRFVHLASMEVGLVPLTIFSSPDGSRAFVSNIFSGTVSVVDLIAMEVVEILEVGTSRRADKSLHQGAHGLALIP